MVRMLFGCWARRPLADTPRHTVSTSTHSSNGQSISRSHILLLGLLTFVLMVPETLPVPVLRGLVVERFDVSVSLATLFMAANMIGALIATPLIGLHVDRTGRRRRLCIWAIVADAALMQTLAHATDYPTFLLLRLVEGAAHIGALTLLMSLVVKYPDRPNIIPGLIELAQEELEHFAEAYRFMEKRGLQLQKDVPDPYVNKLLAAARHGR